MDGDDPTLRPERVEHLTQVAERFSEDDWRQEKVSSKRSQFCVCILLP